MAVPGGTGRPEPERPEGKPDPGLFGPASVTWQLHSDPVMWIGGIRALYLQALHPRAVRGVMQNSDFRADAWGRLLRTAAFVGTVTYAATPAAERAGARVRGIHRRLRAVDPATGDGYRVDEPALLLWVHCAEIDSYLHVARRSGLTISDAHADAYVREQRTAARLVGLDPEEVPGDTAALAAYFERVAPELAATPDSADVDAFLRRPPVSPLLAPARNLLWSRVAGLAYATLPKIAHGLYGRPAPPVSVVDRRLRATASILRAVPDGVRWRLPPRNILKAMDRLGPTSRPSPSKLARTAAILDESGDKPTGNGYE
jgi:uncharacterized protein (DUF2236 family)